jgi:homoserine kinase
VADGFVHRETPHPDLRPVLLVPRRVRLPTVAARQALPADVRRSDAVFNLAHASLMVIALTSDPGLLPMAMRDRLHENARMELVPEVREALEGVRRGQGIPACVSGAGPTLLAFEREGHEVMRPGDDWSVLRPGIRATGVEIVHG